MICPTTGKQSLSRSDALRVLREIQHDQLSEQPELLNVYRCPVCGRWHVGHAFAPTPRSPRE
jgi:predicted RNA-binding Zn-ribbon protein involved in translation (DUF1610 family)